MDRHQEDSPSQSEQINKIHGKASNSSESRCFIARARTHVPNVETRRLKTTENIDLLPEPKYYRTAMPTTRRNRRERRRPWPRSRRRPSRRRTRSTRTSRSSSAVSSARASTPSRRSTSRTPSGRRQVREMKLRPIV